MKRDEVQNYIKQHDTELPKRTDCERPFIVPRPFDPWTSQRVTATRILNDRTSIVFTSIPVQLVLDTFLVYTKQQLPIDVRLEFNR